MPEERVYMLRITIKKLFIIVRKIQQYQFIWMKIDLECHIGKFDLRLFK